MVDEAAVPGGGNGPRIACATDAPHLHALIGAVSPGSWSLERLTAELVRADSIGTWVGSGQGALGLALGRIVLDELHVLDVAVASDHRRRGIGRRVVDALIEAAAARGCRVALLELRESNEAARSLYRASGFVVVGRRPRYYPGGEAATLMNRALPVP